MSKLLRGVLAATLFCVAAAPTFAQEIAEGPQPTTALINAESKHGAKLDPSSLKLEVNGHDSAITSVVPVQPQSAQIAILIDDGLRSSVDVQLRDVRKFIAELPAGTQVLVGYMQNGTIRSETKQFSADHGAVAKQVRITMSNPGISASPYFCLSEFVKHWPSSAPAARMVLMITNGVDPYNGSVSVTNQDSPYVRNAQDDAQRAGVAVYSIYYGNAGIGGGAASFSGQSYLQQVADATGGQSFYNGLSSPPTLSPYLKEFSKAIAESYQVNFLASAGHEGRHKLTRIKLRTDQHDIKLNVPDSVHPGGVAGEDRE